MRPPRGQKQIAEFYGYPHLWVRNDGSAHPSWESQMVTVPFPAPLPLGWDPSSYASRARVHQKISGVTAAVFHELSARGLWPLLKTYDGGYTWRAKRGSRKLSMHAYGAALDFNSATNRLGQEDFDMPREVVRVFRAFGWTWGGQWKVKDAMHYQFGRQY